MRTATTKTLENMAFTKLSTTSILIGVTKELWKRHKEVLLEIAVPLEFAVIIWVKWFN